MLKIDNITKISNNQVTDFDSPDISNFLVLRSHTALDSLILMDSVEYDFLIVTDDNGYYEGVITEKSLKKHIIKSSTIDFSVSDVIDLDYPSISKNDSFETICNLFKLDYVSFLPILGVDNRPINIITKKHFEKVLLNDEIYDHNFDFYSIDEEVTDFNVINRPWGFYKSLYRSDFSQVKVLTLFPGDETSLQKHFKREEYWTIIRGNGEITLDTSVFNVEPGRQIFIPRESVHKVKNISHSENLMLIEVQKGHYFGEDDIVRFKDKYGRV